jgi:hypothetical protein
MDGFGEIDFNEIDDIPDADWVKIEDMILSKKIVSPQETIPEKNAHLVENGKPGEEKTRLEKTMLFIAVIVAGASIASVSVQIIALTTTRQIYEGLLVDALLCVCILVVYSAMFGRLSKLLN